jgi:pilus assembly protein CpaE
MAERILIVDDDIDTLKLIGLMLQRQGYEISVATNGTQGLAKAETEQPDIMLLDLMMPDMDGYEVTRRMRGDPRLAQIPIIMFTAKSLVDDKVAGFEAGADDYLTKPTHPAELTSRVKALLQRTSMMRTAASAAPAERGRIIGFIGARGGLGTTTLALNVALALVQAGEKCIAADLRPGQGAMGLMLGYSRAAGVTTLLGKAASEIQARAVESQLLTHGSGLQLLLSSAAPADSAVAHAAIQAEQITRQLSGLCRYLVLDLGAGLNDISRRVAPMCDELFLVVEPQRVTLTMARALLGELESAGIGHARVDIVMQSRARSSLQTSWQAAEALLDHPIENIVTPAPELAFQAAESGTPLLLVQPDSITADQIRKLAQFAAQKAMPGLPAEPAPLQRA